MMYVYRAQLVRVIDGDTIVADIDLGFSVTVTEKLRLAGINTPELNSSDAAERARANVAKARLIALLGAAPFTVRTYRDRQEKFGRYLADVILADGSTANALLLNEKLAEVYP